VATGLRYDDGFPDSFFCSYLRLQQWENYWNRICRCCYRKDSMVVFTTRSLAFPILRFNRGPGHPYDKDFLVSDFWQT